MTVVYTGVFLEEDSKLLLGSWFEDHVAPVHPKVFCHHMTVCFKPMDKDPKYIRDFQLRAHCSLRVTGYAADEFCQAVTVAPACAFDFPIDNDHPHVTVATNGKAPFYSNELIAQGVTRVLHGPVLSGWTGFWDAELTRACFAFPEEGPTLEEISKELTGG